MKGYIYILTSPNNKNYVGQTWNLNERLRIYKQERCKDQPALYNCFKKYGFEKHKIEILFEGGVTQKELDALEIRYIIQYNSIKNGLNIKQGGSYGKHSQETIEKIRLSKMGEKHPFYGKKLPKEWCDNLSKARQGKTLSESTKAKIGAAHKGMLRSESAKENMRKAQTGKILTKEHRQRISKKVAGVNNPSAKPVCQFDKKGNFIRRWDYMTQAEERTGVGISQIAKACKGKLKTAGGYIWQYTYM